MQLDIPAQYPCLLHIAMCSALCNESVIQYNPDKRIYEKIGESTEVALRLLAEKVSLDFGLRVASLFLIFNLYDIFFLFCRIPNV